MRDMYVLGIGFDDPSATPVLLLQEAAGAQRVLPISIEEPEADALEQADRGLLAVHPGTHQLIAQLVALFGERLSRVSLTVLGHDVFRGELIFDGGDRLRARVGDAVIVAVHLRVPIQVADTVLDRMGVHQDIVVNAAGLLSSTKDADEIAQFRHFLETARPEDFE